MVSRSFSYVFFFFPLHRFKFQGGSLADEVATGQAHLGVPWRGKVTWVIQKVLKGGGLLVKHFRANWW